MIHVITSELYHLYRRELRAMHRLRHQVFKERLDWQVSSADGEERDEYDRLDPVYLVSQDDSGKVVGTLRLLPTTGPNMLRDTFAALLYDRPAPCDPRVWESSRFSIDHGEGSRRNCLATLSRVTSELFCGAVETAMANGIEAIVTVHDARFQRVMTRVGCRPRWTSTPMQFGSCLSMYSWIDMDQCFLDALKEVGSIQGSVIQTAPWLATPQAA